MIGGGASREGGGRTVPTEGGGCVGDGVGGARGAGL